MLRNFIKWGLYLVFFAMVVYIVTTAAGLLVRWLG